MTGPAAFQRGRMPQCCQCGYRLEGLLEDRCPECGRSFDPEFVRDETRRTVLLAWERRELGCGVRRLGSTLVEAGIRPGRFFANAARRSDTPIVNARGLIYWAALVAVLIHAAWYILHNCIVFLRLFWTNGDLGRAGTSALRIVRMTAWGEPSLIALQVAPVFVAMLILAVLLRRLFRERAQPLPTTDIVALLAPTVVFVQVFNLLPSVVTEISPSFSLEEAFGWNINVYMVSNTLGTIYVCFMIWLCSRRLFEGGFTRSAISVVLSLAVIYLSNKAVFKTYLAIIWLCAHER